MTARKLKGAWWVDFRFEGQRYRRKSPNNSKRGAERFERELRQRLQAGLPVDDEQAPEPAQKVPSAEPVIAPQVQAKEVPAVAEKEVPTLRAFADEFMLTYARANNKASEQEAKRSHLDCHLLPVFGDLRLDKIETRKVELFKAGLLNKGRSAKTVNNVLGTLSRILSYAVDIKLIEAMPKIKRLKIDEEAVPFLDSEPYEALVNASRPEPMWHAAVLLGGDAGLRLGEIRALRLSHWHRHHKQIEVQRAFWRDVESSTKGRKRRTVPLTARLQAALEAIADENRVYLVSDDPERQLTLEKTRWHLPRLCRKAGIMEIGWHVLRHTFAPAWRSWAYRRR